MSEALDIGPFLYEDETMVIVNKPSGMLVHRARGSREPIVLMSLVRDLLDAYVYCVHRLDRGTSGAVILARTPQACAQLGRLFQAGEVRKAYLALVQGSIEAAGLIDFPLVKQNGVFQPSHTAFERVQSLDGCSWVRVVPREGRRHQIRRHFSAIGHPVLGDAQYGGEAANVRLADHFGLTRLALHAAHLRFQHPVSHELVTIDVPLPPELQLAETTDSSNSLRCSGVQQ